MASPLDVTKESIRQQIWSYLESNDIARFPRPVYNRIPNFEGAEKACSKMKQLKEYQMAQTIKVNPDSPQKHIRFLTLEDNKVLLVPTPRLRNGLLNRITPPPMANKHTLHICSTSEGVKRYSTRLGLNSKVKVDLVILGSVAVSPKGSLPLWGFIRKRNVLHCCVEYSREGQKRQQLQILGRRIGKGEGYADMEFAMMATMGAVNSETTVVTVVHDCQVLDSIPDHLFGEHDVPVDIIVTPSKIIHCEPKLPKPSHIIWSLLSEEKISEIPILRELKKMEERCNT